MITNDKEIIWMEKYRPQRIEDLVLPDHYINSFKEYIKNPRNILLTSETPGTGKTSISNAIIKEGQFECLFINASLDNGIDTLRGKIRQFASSIAFNDKCKIVVLDEVDGLSDSAQAGIRAIFEEFSSNCRFILTCNYLNKIIEPIINRCEIYNLDDIITKNTPEMIKKIFERLEYILKNENVTYNQSDVVNVIKQNLPSLRSMVAFLQRCVVNNELIIKDIELSSDFNTLLSSIKSKSFEKIIETLYNLPNPDSFYTYSFKHLNIFKPQAKPQAIITLAKYQDMSSKVRDKNLNLCACIMELIQFIDI
nr:MAG TPA: activator clamp loader [Caudoviricetes sp.]